MKNYFLVAVLALGVWSCTSNSKEDDKKSIENPKVVVEGLNLFDYDGKIMTLKVNQVVKLQAEENMTTGFMWSTQIPKDCVMELVGEDFVGYDNPENMLGVGGTKFYDLKANGVGECSIRFNYSRDPEVDTQLVMINFVVEEE